MDVEFNRRCNDRAYPFNGLTIHPADYMPLRITLLSLVSVAKRLERTYADRPLYRLDDWYERGGQLTEATLASWDELWSRFSSEETLHDAFKLDDRHVRHAFFPDDRGFYLRIHVPGDEDNPFDTPSGPRPLRCADFDITCAAPLATSLAAAIRRRAGIELVMESPSAYFQKRFASKLTQ